MKNKTYICVSGPAAVGKTTLIEQAEKALQAKGINVAATLSSTNRPPRKKPDQTFEVEGVDYRFYTPQEFSELKEGQHFFITSQVHGNEYGTLKRDIVNHSAEIYLMNIDSSGAMELKERYPDNTVLVYIAADIKTMQQRLERREPVSSDDTERRKHDRHQQLMAAFEYDYIIFNNGNLSDAVEEFSAIILAQRNRRSLPCNMDKMSEIINGLDELN